MFNDYEWKSSKDFDHYRKAVEDNRIFIFLIGLNVEYDEVRGRIIGRQQLPFIAEVFAEVRREESRRLVMLGKKATLSTVETSTLNVTGYVAGRNKKGEEKQRIWCDIAIDINTQKKRAGRYMENQQIGRAHMKENSLKNLLQMR